MCVTSELRIVYLPIYIIRLVMQIYRLKPEKRTQIMPFYTNNIVYKFVVSAH